LEDIDARGDDRMTRRRKRKKSKRDSKLGRLNIKKMVNQMKA
jgi:hypothetical protein